jgi:crotonobetainyl-CoA:carnitine CoA-transferase CaiB-like acyl-CoA transferase
MPFDALGLKSADPPGQILEGIKVFDLTIGVAGPWATKLLAELGAEVHRISPSDAEMVMTVELEDGSVEVLKIFPGLSTDIALNKRRHVLDLKTADDRDLALEMIRDTDLVVTNMRPSAVERMGLDYPVVSKLNPEVIYVSLLGWGREGPLAGDAAVDPLVQCFTGWASLTGRRGSTGELNRHTSHLDITAASMVTEAALLGLIARNRSGFGQQIDISMLDAALAAQTTRLADYFATGEPPRPLGSAAAATAPHQAFRCKDGIWLAIGVERQPQWEGLCRAIRVTHLVDDPRFASNEERVQHRDELSSLLEARFAKESVEAFEIRLQQAGVPHSRVRDLEYWEHHKQAEANGWIVAIDSPFGEMALEGPPWRFSGIAPIALRVGE